MKKLIIAIMTMAILGGCAVVDQYSGSDGKGGANGKDGKAGVAGVDGKDGADGATGLTGPQGATGADGQDGKNFGLVDCSICELTDNGLRLTDAEVEALISVDGTEADLTHLWYTDSTLDVERQFYAAEATVSGVGTHYVMFKMTSDADDSNDFTNFVIIPKVQYYTHIATWAALINSDDLQDYLYPEHTQFDGTTQSGYVGVLFQVNVTEANIGRSSIVTVTISDLEVGIQEYTFTIKSVE